MSRRISQDEAVEEAEFLTWWGMTPERIAERLDSSVAALSRALYRAGRPELAAAFKVAERDALREQRSA